MGIGRIAPLRAVLPADGGGDVWVIGIVIDLAEELVDFGIRAVAYGPQKGRYRNGAAFIYFDRKNVFGAGFELQPRSAIGDELGAIQEAAAGRVFLAGVIDARRAHQLAHHHALRAVVDERAGTAHERKVAHEDGHFLDLTGLLDEQLRPHTERRLVGKIAFAAFVFIVRRPVERLLRHFEAQLEVLARKVLDGRDLREDLAQPISLKPTEGPHL